MNELRATSRESRVEKTNHDAMHRRCAVSLLTPRPSHLAPHPGTTLIELLITITIIAILSATFLGVSNSAIESSRRARTKTTIAKIHGLLMEKWNSYATRRVDISATVLRDLQTAIQANVASNFRRRALGEARADLRLLAVRELMKLEMPDRWSDVMLINIPDNSPLSVASNQQPSVLSALPALTQTFRRQFLSLDNTVSGNVVRRNQGAECLFMIVMLSTGDGEARSLFNEQDIGDTDGDGAQEFLDGWGTPIQFIRWPAGFADRSDLMAGSANADSDHDSFDLFRRDQVNVTSPAINAYPPSVQFLITAMRNRQVTNNVSAFRLVPLIYSPGSDSITDVNSVPGGNVGLDPYGLDQRIGGPGDINNDGDDNSLDNIHNHLQDNK